LRASDAERLAGERRSSRYLDSRSSTPRPALLPPPAPPDIEGDKSMRKLVRAAVVAALTIGAASNASVTAHMYPLGAAKSYGNHEGTQYSCRSCGEEMPQGRR
jgi:hypothetical protein